MLATASENTNLAFSNPCMRKKVEQEKLKTERRRAQGSFENVRGISDGPDCQRKVAFRLLSKKMKQLKKVNMRCIERSPAFHLVSSMFHSLHVPLFLVILP